MSKPIRFEIDMRGEHPVFTPCVMDEDSFECQHHGDIDGRVIALAVADDGGITSTGPLCVVCLANMLRCCRVEPKGEQDDG